jgi:acyl carrier protein
MSKEEFIKCFSEATEIEIDSNVAIETSFRELDEWSSLAGLCVMQMMTELTKSPFTVTDIKSCNTIGDLYNYIVSNENS